MRPAQDAATTVLPGAANDGFNAGPSIGDLPQDEVPARMLFVRNLSPATHPSELQHAFEVSARPPDPLPCNPSACRCSRFGKWGYRSQSRNVSPFWCVPLCSRRQWTCCCMLGSRCYTLSSSACNLALNAHRRYLYDSAVTSQPCPVHICTLHC